jgi:hypothetical protein
VELTAPRLDNSRGVCTNLGTFESDSRICMHRSIGYKLIIRAKIPDTIILRSRSIGH